MTRIFFKFLTKDALPKHTILASIYLFYHESLLVVARDIGFVQVMKMARMFCLTWQAQICSLAKKIATSSIYKVSISPDLYYIRFDSTPDTNSDPNSSGNMRYVPQGCFPPGSLTIFKISRETATLSRVIVTRHCHDNSKHEPALQVDDNPTWRRAREWCRWIHCFWRWVFTDEGN